MSAYDQLFYAAPNGELRREQVKLWGADFSDYHIGDTVPSYPIMLSNYSIALRSGGYANIEDGKFNSWTPEPVSLTVFDKWGDRFTETTVGLLGEPYFTELP